MKKFLFVLRCKICNDWGDRGSDQVSSEIAQESPEKSSGTSILLIIELK